MPWSPLLSRGVLLLLFYIPVNLVKSVSQEHPAEDVERVTNFQEEQLPEDSLKGFPEPEGNACV